MPFTHQKTVTVSPSNDNYSWTKSGDGNGNWVEITQAQGDVWNFTVSDNSGTARQCTCTVTHSNGYTSDSFTIYQAGPSATTTAAPTTTTTSTTTTTTSTTTTTTAAPAVESAYWFHLGAGGYPYDQDLINGTLYLSDNSVATDFSEVFADMLANPSAFEAVENTTSISNGTQFVYEASVAANNYWLLIPDSMGIPDLTQTARLADTQNGIADVAAEKLATQVGGSAYTLYRINLLAAPQGVTIQYNV